MSWRSPSSLHIERSATFAAPVEIPFAKVTWAMDGHHTIMTKAVTMFMDMDKQVGADFENG